MIPGGVREYKLATRLECDVPTVIPARGMAFLSPNRVVLGVGVYNQKWRGVYRTVMLLPLLLCSLHVPECAGTHVAPLCSGRQVHPPSAHCA
jgi:hypothetical protein